MSNQYWPGSSSGFGAAANPYEQYARARMKARKAKKTGTAKPGGGTFYPYGQQLTYEQIKQLINDQVHGTIDPMLAGNAADRKQAELDAERARQAIIGYNAEAGRVSAGMVPQITKAYSDAAAATRGDAGAVAGGITADLAQSNKAAQDFAALQGEGGAAQNATIDSGYNAQATGDTVQFLGGTIPAQAMDAQGPAFTTAGADLVQSGLNAGLLALRQENQQHSDALAKLDAEKSAILAQTPKLRGDAYAQVAQIENDQAQIANAQQANRIQQGYLQLQYAKTNQDIADGLTNVTGTVHVVQGNKVVDTGQPAPGTSAGQVTASIDNTTARVKAQNAKTTATTKAKAQKTTATAIKAREDAFATSTQHIYAEAGRAPIRTVTGTDLATGAKTYATVPYRRAFTILFNRHKALLRYASGSGRAQLRKRLTQIINEALAAQGITPATAPAPKKKKTVSQPWPPSRF